MSQAKRSDHGVLTPSQVSGRSGKIIASCFALTAFAVAIIAGLAAGNDAGAVLVRALLAMIGCHVIGLIVGMICQHVVTQHVASEGIEPVHPEGDAVTTAVADGADEEIITA